jgi:hypothetical protein
LITRLVVPVFHFFADPTVAAGFIGFVIDISEVDGEATRNQASAGHPFP